MDEPFVREENAEIGYVQGFSELFSGNKGENFSLQDAFQLLGEDTHEISNDFLEVGVVDALEEYGVDMKTCFFGEEGPFFAQVEANEDEGFIDFFYFGALG